jgi:hypothetical protein
MHRRLLFCLALLALIVAACQGPPPTQIIMVVTATPEEAQTAEVQAMLRPLQSRQRTNNLPVPRLQLRQRLPLSIQPQPPPSPKFRSPNRSLKTGACSGFSPPDKSGL